MRSRVAAIIAVIFLFVAAGYFPALSTAQGKDGFPHGTAAHKKVNCASCHKIPTANWVGARGFPDVADYPGHTACNSCHSGRQFLGICNSCHVSNITPRSAPRFAFPRSKTITEFNTVFPHDVHQDVIANRERRDGIAVAHFVNASYRAPSPDEPPQFNNCAICHKTVTANPLPKLVARTPSPQTALVSAAADPFVAKAGYFKDMPSGHATCFACHYQTVKPIAANCVGCHSLTAQYTESTAIKRYSFKFDHLQKEHAVRDCMTCHVRISQNADVRLLKDADVPFMACSSCHNDKITAEMKNRADTLSAGQPAFQCVYCHTTDVGRFPVPKSHEIR